MNSSVMVAHESDLALAGVRSVFDGQDFEVSTSLQLAELVQGLAGHPSQVVLLSDRLEPDLDVLALVERVRDVAPHAHLIVLGSRPDGLVIHDLLNLGVLGYLYKYDLLGEDLIPAVKTVLRERPYLSPTANVEYLLAMQSDRVRGPLDAEDREVLRLMANGYRSQEIALRRGLPIRRVYWVANKLRDRFGAETNAQLMVRAAEEGFLP
jgi:DNA-binding NarL/FixJ family response regulator